MLVSLLYFDVITCTNEYFMLDPTDPAQSGVQIWCNPFLRINESLTPHFRSWVHSVPYIYTNHRSEMFDMGGGGQGWMYFFGAVIILFFKKVHTQQCLRENTVLCIETRITNSILISYIILLLVVLVCIHACAVVVGIPVTSLS